MQHVDQETAVNRSLKRTMGPDRRVARNAWFSGLAALSLTPMLSLTLFACGSETESSAGSGAADDTGEATVDAGEWWTVDVPDAGPPADTGATTTDGGAPLDQTCYDACIKKGAATDVCIQACSGSKRDTDPTCMAACIQKGLSEAACAGYCPAGGKGATDTTCYDACIAKGGTKDVCLKACPDGGTTPTGTAWAQLHAKVIKPTCAGGYCHGGGAGSMKLTGDAAADFTTLTTGKAGNKDAAKCAAQLYVVAGKPAQSLLWLKVDSTAVHGCGDHMPAKSGGLSAAQSELVKAWIAGGAKP